MSHGGTSPWGEWQWSVQWNCYERTRCVNGEWMYEYDTTAPAPSYVPRQMQPLHMTEVTSQMQNTHLSSPYTVAGMGNDGPSRSLHTYPSTGIDGGTLDNPIKIPRQNPSVRSRDLDKKFRTHNSSEFVFGSIFKVLWSEPTGNGDTEITIDASFGQSAHHKIRRFVVVDSRRGHSICLPILTYGGQGTLKHGAHPEDHAVIYSEKKPKYFGNEADRITKKSIKCVMNRPEHKLDPASRLNYAKLYTVEHNVKVCFVGFVAEEFEQKVVVDYNSTHPSLADRPGASGASSAGAYTLDASPQGEGQSNWKPPVGAGEPSGHSDLALIPPGEQFDTRKGKGRESYSNDER